MFRQAEGWPASKHVLVQCSRQEKQEQGALQGGDAPLGKGREGGPRHRPSVVDLGTRMRARSFAPAPVLPRLGEVDTSGQLVVFPVALPE